MDDQKRYSTNESLGEKAALEALDAEKTPAEMEKGAIFLCYHGSHPEGVFGHLLRHMDHKDPKVRQIILHGLFLVSRVRGYISLNEAAHAAVKNAQDADREVRASASQLMQEVLSQLSKRNIPVTSLSADGNTLPTLSSLVDFERSFHASLDEDNMVQARELCLAAIASNLAIVRAHALRACRLIFMDDHNVDREFMASLQEKTAKDPSLLVQDVRRENKNDF